MVPLLKSFSVAGLLGQCRTDSKLMGFKPCSLVQSLRMKKKEGETSNRPDNTAFTQQRLPAWQPMLSAGIVIPGFVVIGLAFIGVGVALFITSQNIQTLEARSLFLSTPACIIQLFLHFSTLQSSPLSCFLPFSSNQTTSSAGIHNVIPRILWAEAITVDI